MSRICGDKLEVTFAPDGSLADAWLLVRGRKRRRRVTAYLKGLTEENAPRYLRRLGFQLKWKGSERAQAGFFEQFIPTGLLLETCIEISSCGYLVIVIKEKDRNIPCPKPVLKVLTRPDGWPLSLLLSTSAKNSF